MASASLSIRLRVVAAVLATITVLLAGWYYLALRQDYTVVYQELNPADAAAVTAALQRAAIPYRIAGDGDRVLVPASEAERVREEIGIANIRLNNLDGFELFNDSDMGLTDFAQKIKYQRALQGELARTIMMMDGILEARVHISMPERTLFRGERRNAEAAVTIVTAGAADATPARIEGVQRLVAASVSDLSASDVVVLNVHGEVISAANAAPERVFAAIAPPAASALTLVAQAAVRRALPDQMFEVIVQTLAPTPELDGPQTDSDIASTPIRTANVSTATPLNEEQRARVRAELYAANFGDGRVIESVFFNLAPAASTQPPAHETEVANPAQVSPRRAERTAPEQSGFEIFAWVASAALLLALTIVCVFAVRGGFVRQRLSRDEHESFAERLKKDLERQGQGAADVGG